MKYFLSALAILLIACSPSPNAEKYKIDLQYYDNAVKFAKLGIMDKAIESCNQTILLRSECFTSFAQIAGEKNISMKKKYCDEIIPEYKMPMEMQDFKHVYSDISPDLEKELQEKLNPSELRTKMIQKIKNECLAQVKK